MQEIAKPPQIRSKALCIAEGDGVYFPQFEKKNQINTKNDELNFSLIIKICTMSGFFNENLQGKSTDDNKISNYLSQLQL